VLVVPPSKFRSLRDLVVRAPRRSRIDQLRLGAASTQLNAERFRRSARIEAGHIPSRAPRALTEVMAGRIDFYIFPYRAGAPLLRRARWSLRRRQLETRFHPSGYADDAGGGFPDSDTTSGSACSFREGAARADRPG